MFTERGFSGGKGLLEGGRRKVQGTVHTMMISILDIPIKSSLDQCNAT